MRARRAVSFVLALLVLGVCARAAIAAPPPIVGNWKLSDGQTIALAADGNARGGGRTGTWSRDGATFVITWFNPKPGMENEIEEVDRVAVSADGTALSGKTDTGGRVGGTRTAHAPQSQSAPRGTAATAVATARPIVRVQAGPGSDAGMTAYNGLGRRYAAAQSRTAGAASATSAQTASSGANPGAASAAPGAATAASLATAGTMSGSTSSASTNAAPAYAGASVYTPPPAHGAPSVSPATISFTGPNQTTTMSISLAGFTGYMGFCLAPGNCAFGGTSTWSCSSQLAAIIPFDFPGPSATVTVIGPVLPHVNLDCTLYAQAPFGTYPSSGYYTTPVAVHIHY